MEEKPDFLKIFGLTGLCALIAAWALLYMIRLTLHEYWTGQPTFFILISTEILTVTGIIAGSAAVFARKIWSKKVFVISCAMLIYSLTCSLGKYFETHRHVFLILFLFASVLQIVLLFEKVFFKEDTELWKSL